MDQNLAVFPHAAFRPPLILEPRKFLRLFPSESSTAEQLFNQPVELFALFIEVDFAVVCRAVVQRSEKIGKGREFLKKNFPSIFTDRLDDDVLERRTVAVFFDRYLIEAGVSAERTCDVMWVAVKTDATQVVQVVELTFHMAQGSL